MKDDPAAHERGHESRSADARYPVARDDVMATPIDEELILYDPADGSAHALNHTAAAVWAWCDGTRSQATIAAELAARFDLPAGHADGDVARLIDRMRDLHLVRLAPPPTPADERAAHPAGTGGGAALPGGAEAAPERAVVDAERAQDGAGEGLEGE